MKKTTWLALAMFIVSPVIVIVLSQVCTKRESNAVNLTLSKLLQLQPVQTVVFNADSALLDSAGIILRLTITAQDTAVGDRISYSPEMFQATQKDGVLHIGLSPDGRRLIKEGHLFLNDADLSRVNPDTIYQNDTLQIRLHAGPALSRIVAGKNQSLVFDEARLPSLRLKTLQDVVITHRSRIGHLQMNGGSSAWVISSEIDRFDLNLINSEVYGTTLLFGEESHIGTLRLTGAGSIDIHNEDDIDRILLEPTPKKGEGIDITCYSVKKRRQLK